MKTLMVQLFFMKAIPKLKEELTYCTLGLLISMVENHLALMTNKSRNLLAFRESNMELAFVVLKTEQVQILTCFSPFLFVK